MSIPTSLSQHDSFILVVGSELTNSIWGEELQMFSDLSKTLITGDGLEVEELREAVLQGGLIPAAGLYVVNSESLQSEVPALIQHVTDVNNTLIRKTTYCITAIGFSNKLTPGHTAHSDEARERLQRFSEVISTEGSNHIIAVPEAWHEMLYGWANSISCDVAQHDFKANFYDNSIRKRTLIYFTSGDGDNKNTYLDTSDGMTAYEVQNWCKNVDVHSFELRTPSQEKEEERRKNPEESSGKG